MLGFSQVFLLLLLFSHFIFLVMMGGRSGRRDLMDLYGM